MNVVDLRSTGTLSVEDAKAITDIEKHVRTEYNDFICELARANHIKNTQWLLRCTCRNTYISIIHDSFCRLALLEQKLSSGEVVDTVLVDDKSLCTTVRKILENHNSLATVTICGTTRVKPLQTICNVAKSVYLVCNLFVWSRFSGKKNKPKNPVVLLDMFLLKDSFDKNGSYVDRYYPELIESTPEEEQENIWYLPSLHDIKFPLEWARMFSSIAKSPQNILMKEQWLTVVDYLSAIKQAVTLPHTIHTIPLWRNLDVSELVHEELNLDCGSPALVQALLIHRSFARYKKGGICIKGVIDWFENQVGDRAIYLGIHKWYPSVKVKGYLGFIPEGYYAGLAPVQCEQDGGVLPDELLLLGDAYKESQIKFLPSMPIKTAPAFRFQATMKGSTQEPQDRCIILLAMPMLLDQSARIVKMALGTSNKLLLDFVIKPHPTISPSKFKKAIPESKNQRFSFTNQSIVNLFPKTKLLVTTASSVALEAVLCDIQVAILGNRSGPTINRLDGFVDEDRWSICYTPQELERAIEGESPGNTLDSSPYLTEVTPEGVLEMLQFETH